MKNNQNQRAKAFNAASQAVVEILVGPALGAAAGWGLDKWLGTSPIFLVVLALLGVAAGIFSAVKTAKNAQNNNDTPP